MGRTLYFYNTLQYKINKSNQSRKIAGVYIIWSEQPENLIQFWNSKLTCAEKVRGNARILTVNTNTISSVSGREIRLLNDNINQFPFLTF